VWITYSVSRRTAPLSRARAGALARGRPRNSGEPSGGGSAGRQAGNLQITRSSLCSADVDPARDGGKGTQKSEGCFFSMSSGVVFSACVDAQVRIRGRGCSAPAALGDDIHVLCYAVRLATASAAAML
jgi:hypothetical protein